VHLLPQHRHEIPLRLIALQQSLDERRVRSGLDETRALTLPMLAIRRQASM